MGSIEGYILECMYEGMSEDEIMWEVCRLKALQEEEENSR